MNVEQPTVVPLDKTRFLSTLADAGFPVSSVAAIRDQYDTLPSGLATLLLEWIPRREDRRLQESVAWALLAALVEQPLPSAFASWILAISFQRPHNFPEDGPTAT